MKVVLELYQKATMADFVIKNYDELDENSIQELIEFSQQRGGFFREDLKRFSIKKRASIEYFEQLFALLDIEVTVQKPHEKIDIFARDPLKAPREADEVIGFGKYKGQTWGELSQEYLQWIQGSMQGYNAEIAKKVIVYKKACERQNKGG